MSARLVVDSPSVLSAEGSRLSGWSWLCPCGFEVLGRNASSVEAARTEHWLDHLAQLKRMRGDS